MVTTAWGREGVFGTVRQVVRERCPGAIPADAPDSALWPEPAGLAELFGRCDVEIDHRRIETWFRFPGLEPLMVSFETVSGPIQWLRDAVAASGGDWTEVRDEVLGRWASLARPAADGIEVLGVHGEAHVRRRLTDTAVCRGVLVLSRPGLPPPGRDAPSPAGPGPGR